MDGRFQPVEFERGEFEVLFSLLVVFEAGARGLEGFFQQLSPALDDGIVTPGRKLGQPRFGLANVGQQVAGAGLLEELGDRVPGVEQLQVHPEQLVEPFDAIVVEGTGDGERAWAGHLLAQLSQFFAAGADGVEAIDIPAGKLFEHPLAGVIRLLLPFPHVAGGVGHPHVVLEGGVGAQEAEVGQFGGCHEGGDDIEAAAQRGKTHSPAEQQEVPAVEEGGLEVLKHGGGEGPVGPGERGLAGRTATLPGCGVFSRLPMVNSITRPASGGGGPHCPGAACSPCGRGL